MYKMIRTATSTGYRYYTKHGIGPGTLPKDVKLLDWKDLDNNMTEIWLDRFLTTRELNYYDIYPETMNNELDKIYQSSNIESSDSYKYNGANYEFVTNIDGYWVYLADVDGKGTWRAMPQGSDKSEFSRLSFPISYNQARGFEPINEPSAITKLRKDLGKKLLPKSGQSVKATENLIDLPENFQHAYTLAKNDFDDNRHISHDEFVKLLLSRFDFSLEAANIVAKWYENEDVLADYGNPKELLDYISTDIYDMLDAATDEKEYEIVSKYIRDDEEQLDDIDDDKRSENNSWTQQIESAMNQLPLYFNVRGNNLSYDVTYNNRTVHISFYLLEGAKYTYTIDGDGPYITNQSERIADDIEDYINEKFEDIMSATEEDEDSLPMVDQEYDSAATSINSNKLPAIYKMVNFNEGDIIVDFGGGKFDNAVEYIRDKGATLCVYDPYNRSAEHNREVLRILRENGGADAAVNSNVLNVIKEPEARKNVLENIARITKPGAPIYITVYEGKGNGQEGPTKSGYQLNRKTADYLEEIQEVFPDATRKGKLITAHNSNVSAATNVSNIGAKVTCSDVDSDTWVKLAQKKVLDSDGFYTDYTMYSNEDGTSYIFMFGDEDVYGPDPQYADYECSNWDEAAEWWNDYNGFEDDNSLNDIQSSSSTDVTGSISAEEFFTKDDLIEFVISVEDEINRRINPKKKFNVSDAYVDGRNIHIELHNDEYELSGEVSVDMRSIRRPSDIHKYLKPVVDEMINQYNEYRVDDITASAVLDMNPEFRNNFEEAVDFFYEDYPATVELTDEVDEDYDTLYKAYVKEIGSLYQQTPGIVYIDINWDSGEILQALQETAEAIGIEHYPDTIESSEPVEGDTFSQLEDAYLSPPEYDEPTEFDDAEELVEVSLDNNVYVDTDGELYFEEEYLDNNHDYTWASYDNGKDWYSYDYPNIKVDDPSGVAEKIGELLYPNVPSRPGWYHVTGTANLYYRIENVVGYESDYNEGEYEYESDNPDYDDVKSSIANLKVEYIGQSL